MRWLDAVMCTLAAIALGLAGWYAWLGWQQVYERPHIGIRVCGP